ncbi:MAG: hypothetical protein GJ680_13900 [Alteromonadaceae bacterium]|nr:hypothetical protein [Alteromonadaceae bacterium]
MQEDKTHFFDKPENVKRLLMVFYACCAILVILDFVLYRKAYHSLESIKAFYPIYGFVGCVLLVVIAKWMRTFLMRDEEYYEPLDEADKELAMSKQGKEENVGH